MDLFKIEPGLFIWTWITFGFLFLVLAKWVYPPLLASVKQREKKIADSVDKANEIEKRLFDIEKEHQAIIAEANKRGDELLREVRRDADVLRKKLEAEAEKQAEGILEDARKKIDEERLAVLDALRDDIAKFVLDASGKLVDHSFDNDKEKQWVKKLVTKL